ncbi:type VI secretion system Vgr family protein [Roseateles sp. BYS87W]|uniref:Type VI secretion system Vgr family protein n=1 Tax=Pelomonas baiyunensis TaxID=3299026 RepID=A0ABW7H508_9BURK
MAAGLPAAAQAVLASLVGPLTQNQRLVQLHTTLGPHALLAERLSVLDGIGPCVPMPQEGLARDASGADDDVIGYRIDLTALSEDAHIDLTALIGEPALVEMLTDTGERRAWHGHITRAVLLGADGGLARYQLRVEPWLAFLRERVDAWVFQDASVPDIAASLFADYAGQGPCQADWRLELQDASVYKPRSRCTQYHEADLAFLHRLLLQEGLFYRFEHEADPASPTLGSHTLVIADHLGAFQADDALPRNVRFTQAISSLDPHHGTDSLTLFTARRRAHVNALQVASRDERTTQMRPVHAQAQAAFSLTAADIPGAYAYPTEADGQRLLDRRLQALAAWGQRSQAAGPWRAAEPGLHFTLSGHPRFSDGIRLPEFVVLSTHHQARNNLSADARAALVGLNLQLHATERAEPDEDEPLHHVVCTVQPASPGDTPLDYRALPLDTQGQPDPRLIPAPTVNGLQTALVTGEGDAPIHTDRDHRLKVQFHWQRGARSSHRLDHTAGDNAPGDSSLGTWVPMASAQAGANWGAVQLPRVGQEVLVAFTGGDIDRPVILGAVPNAQGQANVQAAQPAAGAATSTGNAPAWFPGDEKQGPLEAHAHPAVLSGLKTQELSTSQSGTGGYSQLVLDDSPQSTRLELSTTQHGTRLQLGHLRHQDDNRRLHPRGHGFDLQTHAHGAVRAGAGLLLSTHTQGGSDSHGQQLEARQALQQLDQGQDLLHTLAHSAQQHQAQGGKSKTAEPTLQAKPLGMNDEGQRLPNQQALRALTLSLGATQHRQGDGEGGAGRISAWGRPDLILASPQTLSAFTPASVHATAGGTTTFTAGQDLARIAQGHQSTVVQGDVTLYTYGRASNKQKPTRQTGMALHAAQGSVHVAALKSTLTVTASKAVSVSSTQGAVKAVAKTRILLTAGGSAVEISQGRISLKSAGKAVFRARQKNLAGGRRASGKVALARTGTYKPDEPRHSVQLDLLAYIGSDALTGAAQARVPYTLRDADGRVIARGRTDAQGKTARHFTDGDQELSVYLGDGDWQASSDGSADTHAAPKGDVHE